MRIIVVNVEKMANVVIVVTVVVKEIIGSNEWNTLSATVDNSTTASPPELPIPTTTTVLSS